MTAQPPLGAAVWEVTDYLRSLIHSGSWLPGTRGPRLDDLNEEFFGEDAGPKKARAAYAPLVEAGIVVPRTGPNGGHFLMQVETETLDLTRPLTTLRDQIVDLMTTTQLYAVELQGLGSNLGRNTFGNSLHRSRLAAEDFVVDYLARLGGDEETIRKHVPKAGLAAVDIRDGVNAFGVRIWGVSLTGEITDPARRTRTT